MADPIDNNNNNNDKQREDDEAYEKEMRKKIQEVQRNTSLTPQEKSKMIQKIMSSRWLAHSEKGSEKKEENTSQDTEPTYNDKEKDILGCKHYKRNCKMKANCCGKLFTCRRCHDELVTDHKINRYLTQEMLCMFCKTIQPVNQDCNNCSKSMGNYYCKNCKFWDDDKTKKIFHCDKCGMCRIGDRNKYVHCDVCHMCLPPGAHTHLERAFEVNCPICNELLQTSVLPAITPEPCRHAIHSHCFENYITSGSYSCPICMKTYKSLHIDRHWQQLRLMCRINRMPKEYKYWKCEILCNDCNIKNIVSFHFIAHECPQCKGFNTRIVNTIKQDNNDNDNDDNNENNNNNDNNNSNNNDNSSNNNNDGEFTEADLMAALQSGLVNGMGFINDNNNNDNDNNDEDDEDDEYDENEDDENENENENESNNNDNNNNNENNNNGNNNNNNENGNNNTNNNNNDEHPGCAQQ